MEDIVIDLRDFLKIMKRRINIIIIPTLLIGIVSIILNYYVFSPVYQSKASIVIGTQIEKNNENSKSNSRYNDVMMYQKLIKTYVKIAESRRVAEKVSNKVGDIKVEKIQNKIKIIPQEDSQIFDITIEDKDPKLAYEILNTLSKEFISESKKIDISDGGIEILDKPIIPKIPIKPRKRLNVLISLVSGLIIFIGMAVLIEYISKIKEIEEKNKIL